MLLDPGQVHVRPRGNGGRGVAGGDLGQRVENPAAEERQRKALGAAAGQDRIVRTALRFPRRGGSAPEPSRILTEKRGRIIKFRRTRERRPRKGLVPLADTIDSGR